MEKIKKIKHQTTVSCNIDWHTKGNVFNMVQSYIDYFECVFKFKNSIQYCDDENKVINYKTRKQQSQSHYLKPWLLLPFFYKNKDFNFTCKWGIHTNNVGWHLVDNVITPNKHIPT